MITQAVLLAGGRASRLDPITRVTNKHLLPVFNKPILFHGLELLKTCGIEDVVIILGGNSVGDVVNLIKDGSEFGLNITYKYQTEPKGISHAILLAQKEIYKGRFLVLLGDNVFGSPQEVKSIIESWSETKHSEDGLAICVESTHPEDYGQPTMSPDGKVHKFVEKHKQPHPYIVVGLYGLPVTVFEDIKKQKPSKRGELEITDTLNSIKPVRLSYYEGFWTDCGTPEGLVEASLWFSGQGGLNEIS